MDWMDSISRLFTDCPQCRGNGCEVCGGHGVVLSEAGRQAQKLGDEMYAELPAVSKSEVRATITQIKAREAGIRVVTDNGEFLSDPYKRPRR